MIEKTIFSPRLGKSRNSQVFKSFDWGIFVYFALFYDWIRVFQASRDSTLSGGRGKFWIFENEFLYYE